MKVLKIMALAAALVIGSASAYAESTLTVEQQNQVNALTQTLEQANKAKADASGVGNKIAHVAEVVSTLDSSEWVVKADAAADALIAFTSKLGVATGDFVTSTSGMLLVFAGLMYMYGSNLIFLISSIIWGIFVNRKVSKIWQDSYGEEIATTNTVTDKDGTSTTTTDIYKKLSLDGEQIVCWLVVTCIVNIPTVVFLTIAL